ncbi:MAG: flagellar M-ring protein FliF [Oligoflexia bacterium]|nr:flagellar M-ring protein FliF [Oligoflexia bacterium]
MEFLNRGMARFSEFFASLPSGKKIAFVGLSFVVFVSIFGLFFWASKSSYSPLVSNLSPEDSTTIIRYLRDKKIPFIVDESGRNISVPPDKVYDLRLELASSGLAQSGVVGYEVFDKQSFGATSTVQRINEQRAREGELVRTINHIKGIERSRVHLAIPQKSAFLEDEKKPTASVILDLVPGFQPSDDQVKGIQRLVAAAVKDLDLNAVTIVSNSGKQLSQNSDDPAAAFAAATLDYQRKFEAKTEDKVQSLLSRVLGEGKVIAKVNADFDFSRVAETQTLFDGENAAIRSVNRDTDSAEGNRPLPGGQPGVRAQTPGPENQIANAPPTATSSTQRNRELTNFEIPKTMRSTEKPMATLKRLSVAVMVDANTVQDANAPGGVRVEKIPEEKLAEFRSIVANAVGWDKDRDPPIEVKSIAFFKEDLDEATKAAQLAERNKMIMDIAKWSAIGLLFTLFFMFVVRPFIKWVTENTVDSMEDFLPQTLEELEKAQAKQVAQSLEDILPEIEEKVDPEKVQSEMLKEKVVALVNDNPHKASQILHDWIIEKPVEKNDNKTA